MYKDFFDKVNKAAGLKSRYEYGKKMLNRIHEAQKEGRKLIIVAYSSNDRYIAKFTAKEWVLKDILERLEEEVNFECNKTEMEIEFIQNEM